MTGLVALGDSFTCGEGVGVRVPSEQTWTGLLATTLADPTRLLLAAPGARLRDVVQGQLPLVPQATVATLLVGLNDIARSGFDAPRFHLDLGRAVARLCARADTVLLGRLHDPVRLLWVPEPLRTRARERLAVVNAAVDEAARLPRVHVIDLDTIPELRRRTGWAVDRVHPSLSGHAAMADAAAGILGTAGHPLPTSSREPSAPERVWWMSRHGLPYAVRNLRDWGREEQHSA